MTIVSLLAAITVCVSLDPTQKAAASAPAARIPLKSMTFNIRYGTAHDGADRWEKRKPILLDVLRNRHSDIIGLQEALRSQLDDVHAALPEYAEIGVGRDDGRTKGEYSAILYLKERFDLAESGTFWFSDTPEKPGSITWGNACTRICTWARFHDKTTDRHFYMFNLHLDHASGPSREKSVGLLLDRIARRRFPDSVIVTGDFNAGEDNPAILRMLKAPSANEHRPKFVDTFRAMHPEERKVATYHAFKGTRDGPKIDYIFAPVTAQVITANIGYDNQKGHYPSDHYPVTANIRLP